MADPRRPAIVAAALSQLGVPYVFGAESPGVAFDCSGLTAYAYSVVGISLPHSSEQQFLMGRQINRDQLQPGDLVFFEGPAPGHVGVWVGVYNGVPDQVCEAPHTGDVVKVIGLDAMIAADGYTGAVNILADAPRSTMPPPGPTPPPKGPDLPQPRPGASSAVSSFGMLLVIVMLIAGVGVLLPLILLLGTLLRDE